jgi:hypothetical protein
MSKIVEYSSKSTALRGIERVGLTDKAKALELVSQLPSGKWGFDHDAVLRVMGINPELDEADQDLQFEVGHVNCPGCGIHLSNGVSDYDGMVDRYGEKKAYEMQQHEWACLGCGHQWGDAIEAPKSKGRKEPTRSYIGKSTVEGAVSLSHSIFDANPDARRKDAIQLAVDAGITFYTARTQYQKWFKARKSNKGLAKG